MADIVNLRAARKAKARDQARAKGDENAARHGRSKAERDLEKAQSEQARRSLDGHRREAPDQE